MTRDQAARLCDEINKLDCGRVADVEPLTNQNSPPFGVRIRHEESGNEIGFAATVEEGRYILSCMKGNNATT